MNRIATTIAAAGIALFGSVALAPAASAAPAQDGPSHVIDAPGSDAGYGPDAFIVLDNGRVPVFFCEDDKGTKDEKAKDEKAKDEKAKDEKEKKIKHAKKCTPIGDDASGRF